MEAMKSAVMLWEATSVWLSYKHGFESFPSEHYESHSLVRKSE